MKKTHLVGALLAVVVAFGCGDDDPHLFEAEDGQMYPKEPTVMLGVDAARTGEIDFDDPDDVEQRWEPEEGYGALFLANIDDDDNRCTGLVDDEQFEDCYDAALEGPGGEEDLADMARIRTYPTGEVSPGTTGVLDVDETSREYVNLYIDPVGEGEVEDFEAYELGEDQIEAEQLEEGVEFAIEGNRLVYEQDGWDGSVALNWTLQVSEVDTEVEDVAQMEQAPLLLPHHLQPARQVYAVDMGESNQEFVDDLEAATDDTGVDGGLELLDEDDPWIQDFLLIGYMQMPGPEGVQTMHVYFRSANLNYAGSLEGVFERLYEMQGAGLPPLLREAGQVVFSRFHGSGTAGEAIYDPDKGFEPVDTEGMDYDDVVAYLQGAGSQEYPEVEEHIDRIFESDTLDSFGNTEVVPPHVTDDGEEFPHGRVVRGKGDADEVRPDPTMSELLDAQREQPIIWIDTTWLSVAHVDETVTFLEADNERGWALLYNDPVRARQMLEELSDDGYGDAVMFEGKGYPGGGSAERTVDEVLDDPEVMSTSARAAVEVDRQVETIAGEVGLEQEETVPLAFLHEETGSGAVAYQPGIINGISLKPDVFGAPDPHGPRIDGEDPFQVETESRLGEIGVETHWIETWDVYHVRSGQVHCGSNTRRTVPESGWWTQKVEQ